MKYGLIDFRLTVEHYWRNSWNKKALLNVGDAAEYLVTEQLYRELGIPQRDIVRLALPELISYRGESLIVAMNIALDSYVGYNRILGELSPDITPVFLGMSVTSPKLSEKETECFRANAPVGCRDQRSYEYLRELGVPCYLNGCTAAVLNTGDCVRPEVCGKVLFIDVPYWVRQCIPDDMKRDIVFLNQELYCSREEMPADFDPAGWAREVFSYYSSRPRLIVTSRFHGAVLAIANDIPAIVTLEKDTFRFSWIHKHLQICTEEDAGSIDWNVGKPDFSGLRSAVSSVAKRRLSETIAARRDFLSLTDMQLRRDVAGEAQSGNQVLYYRRAWEEIQARWEPQGHYSYAFWGVNDNSVMLQSLISRNYPNARLVDVYDMYKELSFNGVVSKKPQCLSEHLGQEDFFLISTAYLSSRVVPDICGEVGFPLERAILCERDFIHPQDIQ